MKTGTYQVTFDVDLVGCEDEEEAIESIKQMMSNLLDQDEFPALSFALTEEIDFDYSVDESELEELSF